MILVPLLNPKFAVGLAALACELRVRGTSVLVGVLFVAAIAASPAIAADIPVRQPPPAPVVVPPQVYNWTGLYSVTTIGGARWDIDGLFVPPPAAPNQDRHHTTANQTIWGSQYGGQVQWGNFVLGVEGGTNSFFRTKESIALGPSADCIASVAPLAERCRAHMRGLWTAGGRLGAAWDRVMLYGTGGYANARILTATENAATNALVSTTSERHGGWYAGAGLEVFISRFMYSDLILGVEYLHIDLESKRHVDLLVPANPLSTSDMEATRDIVRARLVFKYGLGNLVSARY